MNILDRDIYDPVRAETPEQTSWTMKLLSRLDETLDPGPMEKPIFQSSDVPASPVPRNEMLDSVASGSLDNLFPRTTLRISELYWQAMHPPPPPSVALLSSEPAEPVSYEVPQYPPLARITHTKGLVRFNAEIRPDGHLAAFDIISGHPLLTKAVEESTKAWTFRASDAGRRISAVVEFKLNCMAEKKP